MNRIAGGIVAVALLLGGWSAASAQVVLKIGFVDFQKVIDSWPEAKRQIAQLEEQYAAVQADLDRMDEQLQEKKQQLEDRRGFYANEEEEKKQLEQYQAQAKEYLETFRTKRADLEKQKAKTLEEVYNQVKAVVQDVAERHGYSFILRKRDLVYAVEEYDITNEVITELEKRR